MGLAKLVVVVCLILLVAGVGYGQHQGHQMPMPTPAASPAASPSASPAATPAATPDSLTDMMHELATVGSGTAWQPSSGPMYMHHWTRSDWLVMFHYNLFASVNRQGGLRGVTKFESANWFMPMAYHKVGKGTLQLRGMLSAEPFTFPPGGSPLLFQTGETYKGQPLIDRQHPHDLIMELSAQYTLPLGQRATWFTYFGYPGEPALGPVAFPHRMSASENP